MTELQEVNPKNLLAIYDLSLDGQHDAKPVREAKDCEDLAGALQDLPDQGECCRLYIARELRLQETFENHLRDIVPLYNVRSRRGFNSLSIQWAKRKPSLRHALDFIMDTSKGILDFKRMPVTCSIGCYETIDKALVIVIYIIDDGLAKLSKNDGLLYRYRNQRSRYREVFDRYINVFLEVNHEHRRCHHTAHSQEVRFKLYLLQFYHTALRLYEEFSETVEHHSRRQDYNLLYADSQTLAWSMAVADASDYNLYLEKATSMSIVAKSLASLVRETCTERDLTPEIKCLIAEVESLSDVIACPFSMLANRFARQMDLMNTSRNIQDSRDSRLLNLLACIFLPASLATSLLSMSTRFVDLGPLLYDFCGVIVLFASFLALIFLSLKAYEWTKRKLATRANGKSRETIEGREYYVRLFNVVPWPFLVIGWPVVLSSFVMGMVVDVGLGSRILGYGVVAIVGFTLIIMAIARTWLRWVISHEIPDVKHTFEGGLDDQELGVKVPRY